MLLGPTFRTPDPVCTFTPRFSRRFDWPRFGKSAVITCVANEYHQIGGKMVADIFELNGWRGYFLGANVPVDEVKSLIKAKHPDVVALSVAPVLNFARLMRPLLKFGVAFPETPILARNKGPSANG